MSKHRSHRQRFTQQQQAGHKQGSHSFFWRFSRIGGNPDGAISCQVTGTQHCHAKQPFIPSIIPSVRHQGGVGGIPDGGNCPLFDMMSKQGESQRDNVKGKGRTQHNMKDNICCGLRFSFCH